MTCRLGYRKVVDLLLQDHELIVPDSVAQMIASTVLKYRTLPPPCQQEEIPLGRRLARALTHAKKLREYLDRPQPRSQSVALRSEKLVGAMCDAKVVVNLAFASPSVDANEVIRKLEARVMGPNELRELIQSLEAVTAIRERTGRPMADNTKVIRCGCTAWLRAGRKGGYASDDWGGGGPLPAFILDLLHCCSGTHSRVLKLERGMWRDKPVRGDALHDDADLHSAIERAMRDIRDNHKRLFRSQIAELEGRDPETLSEKETAWLAFLRDNGGSPAE